MTWPYRWLFRAKTGKSHYALKKLIYKSTTPQREVDLMNPIRMLADGATSTTDSSVLENSQISYPMAEIVNTGRGSPAYENGCPPNPPGDPTGCPPLPVAPQRSASPATYDTGIILIPQVELLFLLSHSDLSTLLILWCRSQTSPRHLMMLL